MKKRYYFLLVSSSLLLSGKIHSQQYKSCGTTSCQSAALAGVLDALLSGGFGPPPTTPSLPTSKKTYLRFTCRSKWNNLCDPFPVIIKESSGQQYIRQGPVVHIPLIDHPFHPGMNLTIQREVSHEVIQVGHLMPGEDRSVLFNDGESPPRPERLPFPPLDGRRVGQIEIEVSELPELPPPPPLGSSTAPKHRVNPLLIQKEELLF